MTEKEKEAIERLNRFKTIKVLYGSTFAMTIEQLKVLQEDIEIVLNILNEKDKEIEHWKKGFERELEDNRKNTCELLKQDLIIREKDKQIDLILDVFFKRFTAQLVLEYGIENKEQLKQKFEQYFKRKAEQD